MDALVFHLSLNPFLLILNIFGIDLEQLHLNVIIGIGKV